MPSPISSATSSRSGLVASNPPKGRRQLPGLSSPLKSQALNTDPNAHHRTNPIGALRTLLKLLSSLSSRVGRCQYKLTPAEHALSLHLVSILDPYVYQGAKTLGLPLSTVVQGASASGGTQTKFPMNVVSGIVYQPTEILDNIIGYLDSKRDLLSVALCCKHLHDVVFPRHFEYRVVRCKVSSVSVWNHLIGNHSLARNVRRLEIVDERSSATSTVAGSTALVPRRPGNGMVVPQGITQRDTDLETTDDELGMHKKQERYLALALQRMSGLKELKWSCNHSPISIEHIWPALVMRCTTLDTLEIADNLVFASSQESGSDTERDEEDSGPAPVPHMSTLTNAVFRSTRYNYGSQKNPDISRIAEILGRCPNLENLQISFIRPARPQPGLHLPSLTDELLDRRWPHLTGLSLTGLHCSGLTSSSTSTSTSTISCLSDFLSEHPQLERLNLDVVLTGHLTLRPESLPRLKEITAGKDVLNAVLGCNLSGEDPKVTVPDAVRPIECVKGFKLSGVHATVDGGKHVDQELLHHLKRHSKTLRRIELAGWHDMEDIRKLAGSLPGLDYLDLGKRLSVNNSGTGSGTASRAAAASGPATNFEEWLEVLQTLPELRAIHGVKFFYEVSPLNVPVHSSTAYHSTTLSSATIQQANSTPSASAATLSHAPATGNVPALGLLGDSLSAKTQTRTNRMSLMDRSRTKKNDWTASMLVWRCPKLRRVDYWEDGSARVIVLTRGSGPGTSSSTAVMSMEGSGDQAGVSDAGTIGRESNKVRWEVRKANTRSV